MREDKPRQFTTWLNVAANTEVARGLLEDERLAGLLDVLPHWIRGQLLLESPRGTLVRGRRLRERPTRHNSQSQTDKLKHGRE